MAVKKLKDVKKHIIVDTMGNLLAVIVRTVNIYDTKSGINPAKAAFKKYPATERFCVDAGYRKSFEKDVLEQLGLAVGISKRIKPKFEVLPKRWIVERTFAWSDNSRRLAKDFERKISRAQNMFIISRFHTLLKRY